MKKGISIGLLNNNNKLIKSMELNDVPLYEKYILEVSKADYDNEEPCIVIRTCIRNNVYKGFAKYLKCIGKKQDGYICIKDIPDEYRKSLDFGKDVYAIRSYI